MFSDMSCDIFCVMTYDVIHETMMFHMLRSCEVHVDDRVNCDVDGLIVRTTDDVEVVCFLTRAPHRH